MSDALAGSAVPLPFEALVERYLAADDGRPVLVVSLLRYGQGGAETYRRYVEATTPILERAGGEIVLTADACAPLIPVDGMAWDAILITRYPRRRMLVEMMNDPDLEPHHELRIASLQTIASSAAQEW